LLPATENGARRDFGRNGSYLVFRHIQQHVGAFWKFAAANAAEPTPQARTEFAAKLIGRWPDGTPLGGKPRPGATDEELNDFKFLPHDARGVVCPLGSHVRRANPRDALPASLVDSETLSRRHRILRRGRPYGEPVSADAQPDAIDDTFERGLHFICFNASIGRQFEFIQHTWLNNPEFAGLRADSDPLAGDPRPRSTRGPAQGGRDVFTIQSDPVRRRFVGLPRFTTIRGGAYFFMPGKRALEYLASIDRC
jgi:Dyp-type peroxidase family